MQLDLAAVDPTVAANELEAAAQEVNDRGVVEVEPQVLRDIANLIRFLREHQK